MEAWFNKIRRSMNDMNEKFNKEIEILKKEQSRLLRNEGIWPKTIAY